MSARAEQDVILSADVVLMIRDRLRFGTRAHEMRMPIEDMMEALRDEVPLATLSRLMKQGSSRDMVVLCDDGHVRPCEVERETRLAA